MSRSRALLVLALVVSSVPAWAPTAAQGDLGADLELRAVTIEDPIFDGAEPARVVVTIHNHGPGSGSGVLHFRYNSTDRQLTGDQRSDQVFNTTEPIPPGATVNFTLPWEPAEDQVGPGVVIVTITSTSDDEEENNRDQTAVFVERYALSVQSVDNTGHETLPGRATPYRFNVSNDGNVPLHPVTTPQNVTAGWTVETPQPQVDIPRGQTRTLVVLVTPAGAASAGDEGEATIRFEASENPNAAVEVPAPTTTVVEEPSPPFEYGVEVEDPGPVVPVTPEGPPTEVLLHVRNTGSVPDAFNVTVNTNGGLAEGLNVSLPTPLLGLGPGERGTVPLHVALNASAPEAETASLDVRVASVNEALFEPGVLQELAFEVRVAAPDLAIDDVRQIGVAYQHAGTASVELDVTNRGQGPSSATNLTLSVERSGFVLVEATGEVPSLQPDASAPIVLAFAVTNLSGAYSMVVDVDPVNEVAENVETNNRGTGELFVRTAGLVARAAAPLDARPGQFVRYERPPHVFDVQNLGNERELVRVEVESEAGWVNSSDLLSIPAGGRRPVPVSFMLPTHPGREADTIRVTATLVNLTEIRSMNETRTVVVDREPPELVDLAFPENVTATVPFTIRTTWEDAVGIETGTIELTSPTNVTSEHPLKGVGDDVLEANLTVHELGTYTFRIRAVDSSSFANEFTHEVPLSFHSSYTAVPTVGFAADPGNRTIRAGDPIRVIASDPAGLGMVRYQIGTQSGQLVEPFEIPTAELRAGEYLVTVTASNRFDLEATTNATFLVDNEPPSITRFTVEPEDPAPGDQVTFRIEADADTARARLTLRAQAGGEERVPLEKISEGVFEGRHTPGQGTYTASVVVWDAAGNRQGDERHIEVDERSIPWPGTWTLLILAGATAFASLQARRRRA